MNIWNIMHIIWTEEKDEKERSFSAVQIYDLLYIHLHIGLSCQSGMRQSQRVGIQFDLLKFVGFQAISYSNLYEKTKLEEQEVRREIYKGIKRGKLWSILQESTAEFLSC